jgi:hypothetical protein
MTTGPLDTFQRGRENIMAIDQGTATIAVTSQERTWRVNIETPKGADPVVTAYRELVRTGPDGAIISKEMVGSTERAASQVATEMQPFTPAVPGQVSGTELAGLISARADMWRLADIAAAAA